jgi:hypothetical protein
MQLAIRATARQLEVMERENEKRGRARMALRSENFRE